MYVANEQSPVHCTRIKQDRRNHDSRTPNRDTCCFYPCEIFLSHIPIQTREKDKKKRAAERRLRASRTSFRDVILMLKLRHPITSRRN